MSNEVDYIIFCLDHNRTNAKDGEYYATELDFDYNDKEELTRFNENMEIETFEQITEQQMKYYDSNSKVIVKSGLIDIASLIQCAKEILTKTGYWGRYLESIKFKDNKFHIFFGS